MTNSESILRESALYSATGRSVLLYDGVCGFCQRIVRWMLHRDKQHRIRFAALQSSLATEVFARHALDPQQIDSVVLVMNFGSATESLCLRTDAILNCLGLLGGRWAFLAALARAVPNGLRDAIYGWVARNRHRIFASGNSCVLLTPDERAHLSGN